MIAVKPSLVFPLSTEQYSVVGIEKKMLQISDVRICRHCHVLQIVLYKMRMAQKLTQHHQR